MAICCSTKAAAISLTQSTGLDLIRCGINVSAVAPGLADNGHWNEVDAKFAHDEKFEPGEKKRSAGAAMRFGCMARPDDIVAQTYHVDGGNQMS